MIDATAKISSVAQPLDLFQECKQIAVLVAQVAIRILFVASSVLIAAAVFPIVIYPVVLPIVAIGTTFLSTFFFLRDGFSFVKPPSRFSLPRSLVNPPRGMINENNNCWIISLIQFLQGDPQILQYLKIKPNTELFTRLNEIIEANRRGEFHLTARFQALRNLLGYGPSSQEDPLDLLLKILEQFQEEDQLSYLLPSGGSNTGGVLQLGSQDTLDNLPQFIRFPDVLRIYTERFEGSDAAALPIDVKDRITVETVDGSQKEYRLNAFICHHGESIDKGHYTCGRIVDGYQCLMDDGLVTLADPDCWKENLQKASFLSYLPV